MAEFSVFGGLQSIGRTQLSYFLTCPHLTQPQCPEPVKTQEEKACPEPPLSACQDPFPVFGFGGFSVSTLLAVLAFDFHCVLFRQRASNVILLLGNGDLGR